MVTLLPLASKCPDYFRTEDNLHPGRRETVDQASTFRLRPSERSLGLGNAGRPQPEAHLPTLQLKQGGAGLECEGVASGGGLPCSPTRPPKGVRDQRTGPTEGNQRTCHCSRTEQSLAMAET